MVKRWPTIQLLFVRKGEAIFIPFGHVAVPIVMSSDGSGSTILVKNFFGDAWEAKLSPEPLQQFRHAHKTHLSKVSTMSMWRALASVHGKWLFQRKSS